MLGFSKRCTLAIWGLTMKLIINPAVVTKFNNFKLGVLIGRDLRNAGSNQEVLKQIRNKEEELRQTLSIEELINLPKISDWREAYHKFGLSPSGFKSSIESLLRRVVQGKELPTINPIVDIYNLVSLEHMLPIGGDDVNQVTGDIKLTLADGGEKFIQLGNTNPEPIKKGEVVYRDDQEVLCRGWNYRECEKSKITAKTHNICLVVEGLESTTLSEVKAATSRLKALLSQHCRGGYAEFFLDKNNLEATIR